jgi:DNA-binding response OmpR family regulator
MARLAYPRTRAPAKGRVLIVDDDAAIVARIRGDLERNDYGVLAVATAAEMRRVVAATKVDLVILDVILPDEDGWTALRWLRARDIPTILLTGKGEIADPNDEAADPTFDLDHLLAARKIRWRAMRVPVDLELEHPIRFAEWMLDATSGRLTSRNGERVHLTPSELRILLLLARNPHRVITRHQLMHLLAGRGWRPIDHRIAPHILNLRRKLDPDAEAPSLIRTMRDGYMFIPSREPPALPGMGVAAGIKQ